MAKPLEKSVSRFSTVICSPIQYPPQTRVSKTHTGIELNSLGQLGPGTSTSSPSLYHSRCSAAMSAGECCALPQEKSSSLLALPVQRGEPEQWELSVPIFLCHSAYFLIPKMKLQLCWMDVLKCKPPEMRKCWLANCLLSPCCDAILHSFNFSLFPKQNQQPVNFFFFFFLQALLGECSPVCFSMLMPFPASLRYMIWKSKIWDLGDIQFTVSTISAPYQKTHSVIISCSKKEALNTLDRMKNRIYPLLGSLWKTCALSGTGIQTELSG